MRKYHKLYLQSWKVIIVADKSNVPKFWSIRENCWSSHAFSESLYYGALLWAKAQLQQPNKQIAYSCYSCLNK